MATDETSRSEGNSTWTVLDTHAWDGSRSFESTLVEALSTLEGVDESTPLYQYVDVEAVVEVFGVNRSPQGATEIRFVCGRHEVRITRDGTIAVR